MAICKRCNGEMREVDSCINRIITINGVQYVPIPYGKEETRIEFSIYSTRCHDCNVAIGGVHHVGCDVEECPACHEQLIGCDCEIEN